MLNRIKAFFTRLFNHDPKPVHTSDGGKRHKDTSKVKDLTTDYTDITGADKTSNTRSSSDRHDNDKGDGSFH